MQLGPQKWEDFLEEVTLYQPQRPPREGHSKQRGFTARGPCAGPRGAGQISLSSAGSRRPWRTGRGLCFQGEGRAAWEAIGRHQPQEASLGLPAVWPPQGRPPTRTHSRERLLPHPSLPSARCASCLLQDKCHLLQISGTFPARDQNVGQTLRSGQGRMLRDRPERPSEDQPDPPPGAPDQLVGS